MKFNSSKHSFQALFLWILSFTVLIGCKERNCYEDVFETTENKIVERKVNRCNGDKVLKKQEFSLDSMANGYAVYYDNDGRIIKKNYYLDDSLFGPQYYFRQNGKVDYIQFYSQHRQNWLTVKFDYKKDTIYVKGKLLHITISERSPFFDSIPIQSPLLLINEVATVVGLKTALSMKIEKEKHLWLDTNITQFMPFFNTYVTGLKYQFKSRGKYEFSALVSLKDSISGRALYIDTFTKNITVY